MSEKKVIYAVGKKGVILDIVPSARLAMDHGKKTPRFEIDPHYLDAFPFEFEIGKQKTAQLDREALIEKVTEFYRTFGQYSPYGDVLQITKCLNDRIYHYSINFVAQRAYIKPGLAADLVLFIHDRNGKIFFVGIVRRNAPGKDKPGLIGGFMDVKGYHLKTEAETLLSESVQEAGIMITPKAHERKRFSEEPLATSLCVDVLLGKGRSKVTKSGVLILVKTTNTSKQERNTSTRLSRVNRTTAYAMEIYFEQSLCIKDVQALFKAGDDAKAMCIVEITSAKRRIGFGITHHRKLYNEALRKLRLEHIKH